MHRLEGEDCVDADTSEGGDEGCWNKVSSRADAFRLSPIAMLCITFTLVLRGKEETGSKEVTRVLHFTRGSGDA